MTREQPLGWRDFSEFFAELWKVEGLKPLPWQCRLAEKVAEDRWPAVLDLPTASGKTAALDVAVFSLALIAATEPGLRQAPRRIFYVVNRRVIVDEAHERAREIASRLAEARGNSLLARVAQALKVLSGDRNAPPLDAVRLRGGIVRDNRWVRSITQPTIVTSTVDQVGSRLLFRGYGVSDTAAPVHAAVVSHDSLLLLDEAHISRPLVQTLKAIDRFRGQEWAVEPIVAPMQLVMMTATPDEADGEVFRLDDDDRGHPVLQARHGSHKPVQLEIVRGRSGRRTTETFARAIAERALALASDGRQTVAVIVNRVRTARDVYSILGQITSSPPNVLLAIGRMRPLDRDEVIGRIQSCVGGGSTAEKPLFVVATQCLEVGADLDFDAMVCECASLDALRQRFGRLNRRGRNISARGAVIIAATQVDDEDDPIYGAALGRTWKWLNEIAENGEVDFGVLALHQRLQGVDTTPLLPPRQQAPLLFPAYIDALAQTSPRVLPELDVNPFLHGRAAVEPDVNVCWRNDLPDDPETWTAIVSLCPPSSAECMAVPMGVVRRRLSGLSSDDGERSDVLGEPVCDEKNANSGGAPLALLWRGPRRSVVARGSKELRPGDTVVLRANGDDWELANEFGHVPDGAAADRAEEAYRQSRGRVLLRLQPTPAPWWPASDRLKDFTEWLKAESEVRLNRSELQAIFRDLAAAAPEAETSRPLKEALETLANGVDEPERYPGGVGVVFRSRQRIATKEPWLPAMDDGDDETSRSRRDTPVALREHSRHVAERAKLAARQLGLEKWSEALYAAGLFHDLGKTDPRFQAYLLGGTLDDAWAQPDVWAKHPDSPSSYGEHRRATTSSGRPEGFRHEMLSAQLTELAGHCSEPCAERDLVLHLIASHHGYGRPFPPPVLDQDPPDVVLKGEGKVLTSAERVARPPQRIDSGVAERYFRLTRRFGWWGLAYLEAVLRLADQRASQLEEREEPEVEAAR